MLARQKHTQTHTHIGLTVAHGSHSSLNCSLTVYISRSVCVCVLSTFHRRLRLNIINCCFQRPSAVLKCPREMSTAKESDCNENENGSGNIRQREKMLDARALAQPLAVVLMI